MSKPSATKPLLKIGQAAKTLGIHIDTLRRWEKNGKLTPLKTAGGTRFYSRDQLQQLKPGSIENQVLEPETTEQLLERIQQEKLPDSIKTELLPQPEDQTIRPSYFSEIPIKRSIFNKSLIITLITVIALSISLLLAGSYWLNLSQKDDSFQSDGDISKNLRLSVGGRPTPQSKVLAVTTAAEFLEINSDTQINGDLAVSGTINNLSLEATPSSSTFEATSGDTTLTVTNDVLLDQDVSTSSSPTFTALNLSATANQLVLQSGGPTGTLTWTPTATRVITFPDATGEVSLLGQKISNSELDNSSITVSAGTNLSGGGAVSLGGSTTLSLKDSISLSGTLTVSSTTTFNGLTYTWPSSQTANYFLQTNGSGTLAWADSLSSAGGWTDDGTIVRLSTITDNVGIGTTSPGYKLHVVGNVGISQSLTVSSATNLASYSQCADLANGGKLTVNSSGYLLCQADSTASLSGGAAGGVTYWDSATTVSQSVAQFYWDSTNFRLGIGTSSPGDRLTVIGGNVGIGFTTPTAALHIVQTDTAASFRVDDVANDLSPFIIDATGNVGIGWTNTTASLHILNTGTGHSFRVDDVANDLSPFIIDATGNVGIGFTTAGARLSVAGGYLALDNGDFAGGVGLRFRNTNDGTTPAGGGIYQANDDSLYIQAGSGTGGYIRFRTSSSSNGTTVAGIATAGPRFAIGPVDVSQTSATFTASGNAGIGLSFAGGSIPANGLAVQGNVGIGTTTTSATLQVVGNAVIGFAPSSAGPSNGLAISGNVGIGITTANSALTVNGGVSIGSSNITAPTNGLFVLGNVGVGFTTPDRLTQIASDIDITSSNASLLGANGTQLTITGSSGTGTSKKLVLGIDTTDNYGVIQAGNTSGTNYALALNPAGGNVGIGHTNPTANLHIVNTASQDSFRVDDIGNDLTPFIIDQSGNVGIGWTNSTASLHIVNTASQNSFRVDDVVDDSTPFTIDQAGNVSIGASLTVTSGVNLSSTLNVSGNTQLSSVAASSTVSLTGLSSGSGDALCLNSSNSVITCTVGSGGISGSGFAGGVAFFDSSSNITASPQFYWNNTNFRLGIGTSSPGDSLIVASGNVGVGFTTPTASLHVVNPNAQNSFRVDDVVNDTTPFLIDQNGNVGIGTSATGSYKLNVNGATYLNGSLKLDLGSDATGDIYYRDSNGNSVRLPIGASGQALGISLGLPTWTDVESFTAAAGWIDAGAYIRLLTMGDNVGIGTTASQDPIGKLHLRGNNDTTALTLVTTNNSNSEFGLTVLNNGNVGIGTTSPQGGLIVVAGAGNVGIGTSEPGNYRLTVLGDTRISTDGVFTLNLGSDATGDIYYRNSSGNIARLPIGISGQALGISLGLPTWTDVESFTAAAGWIDAGAYIRLLTMGDNVGIGTTVGQDPIGKLHLRGNNDTTALTLITTNNSNTQFGLAVLNNGNVGIGTTAAGGRLVVTGGNVGIGASVPNSTLAIQGNVGIGYTGANQAIPANGLAVAGNVGIGITSPNTPLEVFRASGDNNSPQMRISRNGTYANLAVDSDGFLQLNPSGSGGVYAVTVGFGGVGTIQSSANQGFVVRSGGDLTLRADYDNDGTNTILFTDGANNTIASLTEAGVLSGMERITSTLDGAPTADIIAFSNTSQPSTTSGVDALQLSFAVSNTSGNVIDLTPSFTGGASDNLTMTVVDIDAFSPTNAAGLDTINGIAIGALTDPGATITSTALNIASGWDTAIAALGNVGIGATLPQARLVIQGNVGIGYTGVNQGIPTNGLAVLGNVGIGITTANSALTVNGGVSIGSSNITAPTNGLFVLGNVGIGFTTPTASLHVVNTASQDSFRVDDIANDTSPFVIDQSGNVGIGITSPTTFNLQIAGTVGPNADDTYDLGSSSFRWRDLYLGPSSLNIVCNTAECSTARTWNMGIQEAAGGPQGNLRIGLSSDRDFLTINTGGNVGIGATIPQAKLVIQGNVGIGYTGVNQAIPANGLAVSGNVGVGLTTANSNLVVGGNVHIGSLYQSISAPTNGLFVDGNVGIGATTSTNALDVWGGARITGTLTIDGSCTGCGGLSGGANGAVTYWTGSNTVSQSVANFYWDSSNLRLGVGTSAPSQSFQVNANTSNPVVVTSGGNVGIGVTTPTSLLQVSLAATGTSVNLSAAAAMTSGTGFNISGSQTGALSAFSGDYILINPTRTLTSGSITDTGNFLELNRSNTIDGASGFTLSGDLARFISNCTETVGTCTDSSRLLFLAQNFSSATGSVLAITNAGSGASLAVLTGNVGIGLSNPTGLFQVNPTNSNPVVITSGGNLGIGTTNPLGRLIISGGNVGIGTSVPNATLAIQGNVGIGYTGANQAIPGAGLAVSGNVGIGITTANSNLSVAGNAHIGALYQSIAGFTNGLIVDGNVGIGATTSTNQLDVWGNVGISQSITVQTAALTTLNVSRVSNFVGNVGIGGSLTLSTFTSCNQLRTTSSGAVVCGADGGLESVQVFTTANQGANAFNATSGNITHLVVELVGGGGGGGGTTSTGVNRAGGGGGAGGYSSELLESFSANEEVSVGVGGSGGPSSTTDGYAGGTTSFGDSVYLQATGGSGGTSANVTGATIGGTGGVGSGGDVNTTGGGGGMGSNAASFVSSGQGGASFFGGGALGVGVSGGGAAAHVGEHATTRGSGGSGAVIGGTGIGNTGGNGAEGLVIVWEYSGNAGSDYAEVYDTISDVEAADLVSVSDQTITIDPKSLSDGLSNLAVLQKATTGDSLIGVVSTSPGQTIGQEIVPFTKHPLPIALSGRVPVKVSTESGVIKKGDKLTASSIPGVAMKATKAGQTIGTAMEDFDGSGCSPPDPPPENAESPPQSSCQGKINLFVNTSYSTGARTKELLAKQGLELANLPEGRDVGQLLLAQLLVEKKDIVDQTKVVEVATDRLIAGLEVVTPRVVADEVDVNNIYLNGNLGIGGSGFLGIQDNNLIFGSETDTNLAFKTNNNIVVTIDTLGNLEATGSVIAPSIVTSDILIASDSAKLAVKNDLGEEVFSLDQEGHLQTKTITADKLLIPAGLNLTLDPARSILAYEPTLLANGDTSYEVDVYQSLKNLEERVIALENQVKEIAPSAASASAELADDIFESDLFESDDFDQDLASLDLTPPDILLASGSATLDSIAVTSDADIAGVLTAYQAEIADEFTVFGTSTLSDTLIAGNFTVDGTLSIENGSEINVLGTLFLQRSALAEGLDIFDGKVSIDKDGNIKATSVTADQLKVNEGKSAGSGKILAGQTEVTIENPYVSDNSVIVATPNVPIAQTIAVTDKVNGQSFMVKIAKPETLDVPFDYLIIGINSQTPAPISQNSPGGG